ncbi:MAG: fibronectin type III domain-containing protein [Chloroflexota bacterium]|nr:fibronectin type III domain-containing protein [Chloroflexota bacterium]
MPSQAQNAPPKPTSVSASNISNDSITLSWTKSPGATSYETRYNRLPQSFEEWIDVGNVASYTFTNLTALREYALQVRAKNANGVSNFVTSRATTLDGTNKVPANPSDVLVSRVRHNSLTITWTKSSLATSYEVIRAGIEWIDVGDVASYTFTGLLPNMVYLPQVRAKNAYGLSLTVSALFNGSPSARTSPAPARSSRSSRDDDKSPPPTPTRVKDSLNHLPPGIQVSNWVEGAQGRRVGFDAISRADLIAQGIIDAADLYGYITPSVEICFAAHGRLVFLDAAYAPRRLLELSSYQRAGMTCGIIDRGGTVILLQSDSPPPVSQSSQAAPTQPPSMSDCKVQPWANVKFRQSPPRGLVLGVTGSRDWLPASEQRHGYFKVRLWGREGWISGDYVYLRGDCGA